MSATTRIRLFGSLLGDLAHAVGPVSADSRSMPPGGHARRDAPQVLDQRQAQHDRDRPQLAELERL